MGLFKRASKFYKSYLPTIFLAVVYPLFHSLLFYPPKIYLTSRPNKGINCKKLYTLIQDTTIPVIAIDGGAGTGKGTVRRMIAWVLKFLSLDSGVLYRAIAFKAKCLNLKLSNEAALVQIAKNLNVKTVDSRIFLDGVDQTKSIRSQEIGRLSSQVAKSINVRLAIRHLQLNMRKPPGLVTDGRDQGFIFETTHRFFLRATPEERARRRVLQLAEDGVTVNYDDILSEIIERDNSDINNPANPLRPHPEALEIDTTVISAKDVARIILFHYFANN